MKNFKLGIALLLSSTCVSLTSCLLVPDSGEESGTIVDIAPVPSPVQDPDTYTCNPLDDDDGGGPSQTLPADQGVRGMLYYLQPDQPRYNRVADYLTYGTFAQAIDSLTNQLTEIALYFNRIYIPTRPFDRGFTTVSGQQLQTPQGNTLFEYFAVRHEGRIQLANRSEGLYQMAVLSDDGAMVSMDFGSGYQNIVSNDGDHPTRMGCATVPVALSSADKIPYILDYYQGPRYHISLILMWRPWPMSAADPTQPATVAEATDAFCGVQGNSFYFDSTQDPPAPTANYNALLSRGWAPLDPENYLLPEESKPNPCNEPAPVISNFQVTSITSNSITLAWDTDRPATSQVIYRLSSDVAESITNSDGFFYTRHVVTVPGLQPNMDYVMRALSSSTSGLSSESAPRTIRTRR